MLGLLEAAVAGKEPLAGRRIGVRTLTGLVVGQDFLSEMHAEVPVVGNGPQVIAEPPGENLTVGYRLVCGALLRLTERGRQFLSHVRKNITLIQ